MDIFKQAFKDLPPGRLLDVATGSGGFIHLLVENLPGYTEIIGVDNLQKALDAARQAFPQGNIHFMNMDAAHLEFAGASFDTVCMANSLHHMADLPQVLAEMLRLLAPSGHLLIAEMYQDGQTEAQLTHVYLHHWWAAVDTAAGVCHNETFTRQQIVDITEGLGLKQLAFYDYADLDSDPKDPETLRQLDEIIDRTIQRCQGLPSAATLIQRGEELRQRVKSIGFHSAGGLLVIGEK